MTSCKVSQSRCKGGIIFPDVLLVFVLDLELRLDNEKLENGQYCVTPSFSLLLRLWLLNRNNSSCTTACIDEAVMLWLAMMKNARSLTDERHRNIDNTLNLAGHIL